MVRIGGSGSLQGQRGEGSRHPQDHGHDDPHPYSNINPAQRLPSTFPRSQDSYSEASSPSSSNLGSSYFSVAGQNRSDGSFSHTAVNEGSQLQPVPQDWTQQEVSRTYTEAIHHPRGPHKQHFQDQDAASPVASHEQILQEEQVMREVRWCPVCRTSIPAGSFHHCSVFLPSDSPSPPSMAPRNVIRPIHKPVQVPHTSPIPIRMIDSGEGSGVVLTSRVPNLVPISEGPVSSPFIGREGTRQGVVVPNILHAKVGQLSSVIQPNLESVQMSTSGQRIQEEGCHNLSEASSSLDSDNRGLATCPGDSWETPNSLISRLTAGLTARSCQASQDGKSSSLRGCPSPSLSEGSDSSSYYLHREAVHSEDPFAAAHMELVEESEPYSSSSYTLHMKIQHDYAAHETKRDRVRKYTGSDSISEPLHTEPSVCSSQESDMEDSSCSSRFPDCSRGTEQTMDIDAILKAIKQPILSPYSPDKANIHEFLEPEEIGHINHLIKSLSDAVLTISLPDSVYKKKGFTPLDYMDIHLNAVIRQFFFVFKNEDFVNLTMSDQVALLNGCSLRAVCCAGLYLFSKDSGCWYIPGSTSKADQPVIHISDLLQVYPQHFVSKVYELNMAAAKLNFDWPIGVITNCILMYTPLKKYIQEMDKIDCLRNKYVHLLLKYITWKHGQANAALIFPEMLKVLDAVLLLVDEMSTLSLNLNEEEVMAVEDRLSTLTLVQMAPLNSHSNRFKETVSSWSNLECINLGEIHNRLCMALQLSMLESLQSNTAEYWAASSMYYASNLSQDKNLLSQQRSLPQPDKMLERKGSHPCCASPKQESHSPQLSQVKSSLAERDLMLLRRFLEDVTSRESSLLVQNIKERMDASQIQMIIKKLCS